MTVGECKAVYEVECPVCDHMWVAIVPATFIEIDGEYDYGITPEVQCPSCKVYVPIGDGGDLFM